MPLVNRAPIAADGTLAVTTTVPTAAWPQLGGMTYDPVSGALAVIDAVPAATDPTVGGIRFTNLGSMYVTTVLPAPLFYVGGLPVSADGRMFFSSSPPIGSVGGWPIAGDGGVAGSGLAPPGPVPIFFAPLLTTLVPIIAGNPAFTFTRATTAYQTDNAGGLRLSAINEARFQGARRVQNICLQSQSFDNAGWGKLGGTITANTQTAPDGTLTADVFTDDATTAQHRVAGNISTTPPATTYTASIYLKGGTLPWAQLLLFDTASGLFWANINLATGALGFVAAGATPVVQTLPNGWFRLSVTATLPAAQAMLQAYGMNANINSSVPAYTGTGQTMYLWGAQLEVGAVASDYVSTNVLAAPYNGAGVDGVKYFATDAGGAPIPAATMLGYVAENAATNYCLQSQTFSNAVYNKNRCTVPTSTQAAPDGTLTATTLTDDTSPTSTHYIDQGAFGGGAFVSIYAKAGSLNFLQLAASGPTTRANFNLATGVVTPVTGTATMTAVGNGWYRCTLTAPGITTLQIFVANASYGGQPIYSGTGTGTIHIWGAQVEAGSDPTSYIPTTTVAVTRNAETLEYPVPSNISGVLGTAYCETYSPTNWAGVQQEFLFLDATNFFIHYYDASAKALGNFAGGAAVATANARTVGAINKNVAAWSGATRSVCLNGGAVATGAFAAQATTGLFRIGQGQTVNHLCGAMRNVKAYDVRIANADLITMTAP